MGDIIVGSAVAIIKPDSELTKSNYTDYKASTINFIFSSQNSVSYSVQKAKLGLTENTDSIFAKVISIPEGKWINLNNDENFKLFEVKLRAGCFLLGVKDNEPLLDPSSRKPKQYSKIVFYGIFKVY